MRTIEQYEEHSVLERTTSIRCDFCNEEADEITEPGEPILWKDLTETVCLYSAWSGGLQEEPDEEELIICSSCFAKLSAMKGKPLPEPEQPEEDLLDIEDAVTETEAEEDTMEEDEEEDEEC